MTKRLFRAALIIALVALICGCTSTIETEHVFITPHEDISLSSPENTEPTPEVSNFSELLEVTRGLLVRGLSSGRVNVFEYEGDLNADATAVREELLNRDALGSYALSEVSLEVTPIVSYMDIQIELYYRRNPEQIDNIITISTQRYLRIELLSMLSDCREDAAILTGLANITIDEVLEHISELYYENPLDVAMLPITTIEVYPPEPKQGGERLIELHFAYSQTSSVLTTYPDLIKSAARDIAEAASGENDAEILLSLCTALSELSEYDAAIGSLSEYSSQISAATAYGALFSGSAIGEGYAMAYKALCDSLSIPCFVVRGTRGGLPYAWNIVNFDGSYYHIDTALCDELGMAEGFLKNDLSMSERYSWDGLEYPRCRGPLTYEDVVPPVVEKPEDDAMENEDETEVLAI